MKNKPKCKERRTAANYRGTKTLTLCTGLVLCLILLAAILFRPAAAVRAVDLMEDIAPNAVTGKDADEAFVTAQTDFALRLFRACAAQTPEKNTLVSPLSVMLALAMTGNGAEGQTRAEMEAVLGMPIEDLNAYLYNYVNQLPTTEKIKFPSPIPFGIGTTISCTLKRIFCRPMPIITVPTPIRSLLTSRP